MQAKVARVVAAMRDPNPQAARRRRGAAAAGIASSTACCEDEARELNIGFVSRMTRGRPWVRLKIAATLDGRTALANGRIAVDHRRRGARATAIAGARARARSSPASAPSKRRRSAPHGARGRHAAPAAARGRRQPARDAADGAHSSRARTALVFCRHARASCRTPKSSRCRMTSGKVDLPAMLRSSAARGINELHVEAGFRLNGSLVREGCVDEFLLYLNPSFLGDARAGHARPSGARVARRKAAGWRCVSVERVGDDLRSLARPA